MQIQEYECIKTFSVFEKVHFRKGHKYKKADPATGFYPKIAISFINDHGERVHFTDDSYPEYFKLLTDKNMKTACLNDLLTEEEKMSPLIHCGNIRMDQHLKFFTIEEINKLFCIIRFPFDKCPDSTVTALVWNELTDRAIKKNIPIF